MIEHEADHTVFERRDPLIGNTFDDRFRIDARLAAGGFGAIYRAIELASGRELALKVLHPSLTADPLIVARFRREGETLASLRDPHTVTAYELCEAKDGALYIVMELLRGETLYDAFRREGPLPWRRVAAIARAVCSSLGEAHALGIVHRDLKPANIHLQDRGGAGDFVKVLDFGIAKILQGGELESTELTMAGQMIGTFDYMAPEQMLGGIVGPRCDIYTLGVVMYEMITGRLPFADATSPTHLLAMLLTTAPAPLGARTPVPPALDQIVMRCLEREQQSRYESVAALAADLDRVLAIGAPEATRPVAEDLIDHEEATRIHASRPAGPPTHLTPARGAQLRAAIAPASPIEPIDVRAQGSQPVIMPLGAVGPRAQPPIAAAGNTYDVTIPGRSPCQGPARAAQPAAPARAAQPAAPAVMAVHDDRRSRPVLDPGHQTPPPPIGPAAARPAPHAPYPVYDGRGSQPYIDPRGPQHALEHAPAWQPHHPARRLPGGPTFDAARDAAVGRIVWALVLVFGVVLALVVANLM
jgi:eukaryotic-like serine/threonine-protein kinase